MNRGGDNFSKKVINQHSYNTRARRPRIYGIVIFLILFLVSISSIAFGAYYFYKYKELSSNPDIGVQDEVNKLVESVGKLILLPEGEAPIVAKITNVSELKNKEFFKKAKKGDALIVFQKSGMAILYRDSVNKIVNVAHIINYENKNLSSNSKLPSKDSFPAVAYYNGTNIHGLVDKVEKIISQKYPNIRTVATEEAARKDYKNNIVIDLTRRYSGYTKEIAGLINAKVQYDLPSGEKEPEADILIIVGSYDKNI